MSVQGGDAIRITYSGEKNCSVSPEVANADRSAAVVWEAIGTDAKLYFPDPTLFGVTEENVVAGGTLTLTVLAGAAAGEYPYAVFCHAGNCFAKGDAGNEPVLIIP